MLQLILILSISQLAFADKECPYVYNSINYTRSSILTIKGLPTNLAYNPQTGDLFFTLIDIDSLQDNEVQTKMDQYVLKDNVPILIDNVKGQAAAVDVEQNKVYIATDKGLNVLNKTLQANFFSFKDEDIIQLFKPKQSDDLYAIFYPENEVYRIDLKKNEKYVVKKVPCAFIIAVDSDDNIFYECDSRYIKVLLNGFQEPIEYVGIGKNTARAINVDNFGRVVLAANDGLYLLNPGNVIPKKLMDLDFTPSGLAFGSNKNIYVSGSGVIHKFAVC